MTRRGLVLGCGGTVGSAWQVGALAALEASWGWDPRTASVIVGTSGGASLAALLGAGVGTAELVDGQRGRWSARPSVRRFCTRPPAALPARPGLPGTWSLTGLRGPALTALARLAPRGRTDPAFLDELVDDLVPDGGWVPHPAVWAVALDAGTGRRVAFGSPGAPPASLRDAVRASWAIPGWYPPVTVGGRTYLDGGVASTGSVDLLVGQELDEVVVVAPMAGGRIPGVGGRVEGLLRRSMTRGLDREIAALEAAGTRVVRLCPSTAELAVMGPNFMNPRRRLPAMEAALVQVQIPEGAR
ncbi:patatin-like phospholipase family protein [Pseudonocardia sp. CA-107938]|uniref:patatin-like phospholipase family protein n=1 Tax=Pseudonocardia sp. CA-107938 TaxID=3240021 RepID=UPI003D89BAEC